jgi:amidohydrolase
MAVDADDRADLADLYRDLHRHPELSLTETRTAGIAAGRLRALGYDTVTGVGGTGVVGILRNGRGPTALLRADMDALPVLEQTGLAYASTVRVNGADGHEVPVMHACGHDMHVACLLGAAATLAADPRSWQGTAMLVFQPAEEVGSGAQAMITDGLFDRFGRPAVVLGQHVAPLPTGILALRPGPAFAGADGLRVVLHGSGAHGSRPESSVDPVVMAAATVMRLQGIVSREVAGTDTAVVTVGALRAGAKNNIIPAEAELLLSVRTFDAAVRDRVLGAISRIVNAEAAASGAPREPEITVMESFPAVVNDREACQRTREGFDVALGPGRIVDPGLVTGSEDVGLLASAAAAPCVYWLLGGADPALFAGAHDAADVERIARDLPSNHSPLFAPVVEPTLESGVAALMSAARTWMPPRHGQWTAASSF